MLVCAGASTSWRGGFATAALRWMMQTDHADRWAKGKGAAVLNHKPAKVLRRSTTKPVASRKPDTRSLHYSCLLAKDSEVRGKSLQLGRTYYRRRTLRKTKTPGKSTEKHRGKYGRLWVCSRTILWCIGLHMPSRPLTWNITPRHDMLKCRKPAAKGQIPLRYPASEPATC